MKIAIGRSARVVRGIPLLVKRFAMPVRFTVSPSRAEQISVLSWNVESNLNYRLPNALAVIAQQLTDLQVNHGPYDLIALTEVRANNAARYEQAVEDGHGDYHAFKEHATGRPSRG